MAWDLEYNNAQSLEAGDLTILDGLQAFTVAAVVKLEDNTLRHHILGKGDASNFVRFYFEPTGQNGKLRIPKLFVGISGTTARVEGDIDDSFPADAWVRVLATFTVNDAAGMALEVDGVARGTGSTTAFSGAAALQNTAESLYLGRRSSSPSEVWDGLLGEVAIWGEVLDANARAAWGSGVAADFVRPEALLFLFRGRSPAAPEHYLLPQAGTSADLTHLNGPTPAAEDYPSEVPCLEVEASEAAPSSTPTYGPWRLVAVLERPGEAPPEAFTVTGLSPGAAHKFKARAVDTSGNAGSFTADVTVTPTATAAALEGGQGNEANVARARQARARRTRGRMPWQK